MNSLYKIYLLIFAVIMIMSLFMGCQTKNISDKSITYYKDGKIDRVEKNYFDKTHGFVNWSDGNNKKMPFSDVTISGLSVGK